MTFARALAISVCLTSIASWEQLQAQVDAPAQWNRFRGPGGRGLAVGDAPLPEKLDRDANLLWEVAVGAGHSSPCLWGDRIFLTEFTDAKLTTVCIDRAGTVAWRRSVTPERIEKHQDVNSPATPTPTTDGEHVFVYFGSVGLVCYDFAGKELWRRPFRIERNIFGTATSPIVAGGRVILARDTHERSVLLALDPATGETVWETERDGIVSGWSTPIVWRRDGVDEVVVNGAWWLKGYALEDGRERWAVPGLTDEPAITPVTADGMVFITSYNMNTNPEVLGLPEFEVLLEQLDRDENGRIDKTEADANESVLSRADADGEGDHPLRMFFRFLDADRSGELDAGEWQKIFHWLGKYRHKNAILAIRPGDVATAAVAKADDASAAVDPQVADETAIVWQYSKGVPECPSPLVHDGRVWVVKNGGFVTCLDARTGALHFSARSGARGPCYASPVAGDGKVYTASARGVVTVLAAADELAVLSSNDLGDRIMATPALVDGVVYVRTAKALLAFSERQ